MVRRHCRLQKFTTGQAAFIATAGAAISIMAAVTARVSDIAASATGIITVVSGMWCHGGLAQPIIIETGAISPPRAAVMSDGACADTVPTIHQPIPIVVMTVLIIAATAPTDRQR